MANPPKDIVRAFVEEYQEKRSSDAFEAYIAADFIDHSPAQGTAGGREGVRQVFEMMWAGIPDMRAEIHQQIEDGEWVATRKSFIGTHSGPLFGIAATGKDVRIDLIDFVRVHDGKIVEHWNVVDTYGLMHQLGAITG